MDQEFLKKIGIDHTLPYDQLKEAFEEKQLEYLERQQSTTDEKRLEELTDTLAKIEEASKELFSMASGLAEDDGNTDEDKMKALFEAKKKAAGNEDRLANLEKLEKMMTSKLAESSKTETPSDPVPPKKEAVSDQTKSDLERIKQEDKRKKEEAEEAARKKKEEDEKKKKELAEAAKKNAYQTALKDLKSGNYAQAFSYFKEESEKGNVEAMYLLGTMYHAGNGVAKDCNRAEFWYKEAAKANNVDAMYGLGNLLIQDMNRTDDGLEWLGKAAKRDHVQAMKMYISTIQSKPSMKNKERTNLVMINKKLMALEKDSYQKKEYKKEIQKYSLMSYSICLRVLHVLFGEGLYGILARVFAVIAGYVYYKYYSGFIMERGYDLVMLNNMKDFVIQYVAFWAIAYTLVHSFLEGDLKKNSVGDQIGEVIGGVIVFAISQAVGVSAVLLIYKHLNHLFTGWMSDFQHFMTVLWVGEVVIFLLTTKTSWKNLFWANRGMDHVGKSILVLFGKTAAVIAALTAIYLFVPSARCFVDGFYKIDTDYQRVESVYEYTRGTVNIPEDVIFIGEGSFKQHHYVDKVILPDTVQMIEEEAFLGCDQLAEITVPDSVRIIGKNAFAATGLSEVKLSEGLETIESGAFKNCSSLTSIVIPASVTEIATNAFAVTGDEMSLESVVYFKKNASVVKKFVKKANKKYNSNIKLIAAQ